MISSLISTQPTVLLLQKLSCVLRKQLFKVLHQRAGDTKIDINEMSMRWNLNMKLKKEV